MLLNQKKIYYADDKHKFGAYFHKRVNYRSNSILRVQLTKIHTYLIYYKQEFH